jgi:hypothetical protein
MGGQLSVRLRLTPVYWPWMQRIERLGQDGGSAAQLNQLLVDIERAETSPAELVQLVQGTRLVY